MEKTTSETKAVKERPSLNYSVLCSVLLAILAIGIAVFSLKCKDICTTCHCDGQRNTQSLDTARTPVVYAQMRLRLANYKTYTAEEIVIFTDSVANVGNAYYISTGYFIPPFDGIYSFSVTLCVYPNTWIVFGLMKDDEIIDRKIVGETIWHDCGTSHMVISAGPENKVWVKVLRTYTGVVSNEYGISSFTGVLLNANVP